MYVGISRAICHFFQDQIQHLRRFTSYQTFCVWKILFLILFCFLIEIYSIFPIKEYNNWPNPYIVMLTQDYCILSYPNIIVIRITKLSRFNQILFQGGDFLSLSFSKIGNNMLQYFPTCGKIAPLFSHILGNKPIGFPMLGSWKLYCIFSQTKHSIGKT